MLPFLKPKRMAGIIVAKAKPEGGMEPMNEEGESAPDLMNIAQDLISAVHAKDADAVAMALHEAFECLSSDSLEGPEEMP